AALLWPAFAAAAAACLYSRYIGALALAFQGLFVLGWRRKALTPFLAAAGSAVVVFLPWLALAKSSLLGWPSTDAFHAGPGLFADAAFRYVLGLSAGESPATWAAVAIVSALAVLSAIVILSGARNLAASKPKGVGFLEVTEGTWLPVLYLLVPLAAMFLLG